VRLAGLGRRPVAAVVVGLDLVGYYP